MSLTIKLYDLQTNEIADLSDIALDRTLGRVLNGPRSFSMRALSKDTRFTDTYAGDGFRNLEIGDRKLIVWEDGGPGDQPIFHGRITNVERRGDGKTNDLTITAMDPLPELGTDSEEKAGRIVRGSTTQPNEGDPYGNYDGNFISPLFASSLSQDGISGPDLILQVLTNSENTGAESDPTPGEGALPIDLTLGTFDKSVPPAVDLSVLDTMDWPMLVGDFIAQLVQTGVCDIDLRPLDPSELADQYKMVSLTSKSTVGTDRSATVHFDYWTGSRNAQAFRHVEDFATVNNKLYDYLGPRLDQNHWKGNITPGSPGTTADPTASRARYGTFMSIRIYDSIGTENSSRPLYLALWNAEQAYRLYGRDLLWITPLPGDGALYTAPQDFDAGDLITVKVGAGAGIALNETQRCYGYTKTWSREDVPSVSQLLTSADVSI